MKALLLTVVALLLSSQVLAQSPTLSTAPGNDVNVSLGAYKYVEPSGQSISIHGPKIGGEYTGTALLGKSRRVFTQVNARGTAGNATYDGWCSPFLITPDGNSPNGWALDIGDASPCSETGDRDWYVEARGLIGRDFVGRTWGWSPTTGVGIRHLSNGTTGIPGFRRDNYLYVPFGFTARTALASQRALSVTVEYDRLLRGWQTTRDSELGGGTVPATPIAPAFTLNGFSDVAFRQQNGWAARASAKLQVNQRFSIEPSFIHWNVDSSPVNIETATFTVNAITVREQLGAYEPLNTTNEFVIKFGFHF